MTKHSIKCRLCGQENVPAADAHIFPKGFFTIGNGEQHVILQGNGIAHRTWSGIHDHAIVCRECERTIFSVDDYAIKILKRQEGSIESVVNGHPLAVFPHLDRKRLRCFFAALLWRAHTSEVECVQSVDIGPYEQRIRNDLRYGGSFDYIDAFCIFLESEVHEGQAGIKRMRLPSGINGFQVFLPHFEAFVSLDKRPIPKVSHHQIDNESIGSVLGSPSLSTIDNDYAWVALKLKVDPALRTNHLSVLLSQVYNQKSKRLMSKFTQMCERKGLLDRSKLGPLMTSYLAALDSP